MIVDIELTQVSRPNIADDPVWKDPQYLSSVINWSDESAWTNREELPIRPGMNLYIERVKTPEAHYKFSIGKAPLEISVLISGSCRCEFKTGCGQREGFKVGSSTNMVTYLPNSNGIEQHDNVPLISVGLCIDPKLAHDCLGFNEEMLPKAFLDIINGVQSKPFHDFKPVNRELRMVVTQILNCKLTGKLRQLYMEGKAIEFLASQLNHMRMSSNKSEFGLSSSDQEKIHAAKEILVLTAQSPPSLFKIAKSVNLTHTRLNQGFKEIYGKTVFEYLRDHRLDHAKMMLIDTKMSITDIAHESGFTDSSHFSKQFVQKYGVRPRIYRQNR